MDGRPVLRIAQLEGARHVLVLSQRAGPLAPASWPVRQRGEVTRPPGTARGRAMLLGGEDDPTAFEFKWYTRNLAGSQDAVLDGSPVEDADELVRRVAAMVRDSSIVEVRWRGEGRLGFLRELDPEEGRLGEYAASLEVEWLTPTIDDKAQDRASASARQASASTAAASADDMSSGWVDAVRGFTRPATAARGVVRDIEETAEGVNSAFRRLAAIGYDLAAVRSQAPRVARGMAAAFVAVGDAAELFARAAGVAGADMAQTDEPRAVVGARRFGIGAERYGYTMRRRAYLEAQRLSEATDPELLGVHTAREGEDLRLVVLAWGYATADAWRDVARFNGLDGAVLEAGQRVRMPRMGSTL